MEAARSWGVSHSVLTGHSKPGEAWTRLDTAYAVSLTLLDKLTCSGCGHDRRESMNPDNEFRYEVDAVRCHSCATRDRHIAALPEEASRAGLTFPTHLKELKRD